MLDVSGTENEGSQSGLLYRWPSPDLAQPPPIFRGCSNNLILLF